MKKKHRRVIQLVIIIMMVAVTSKVISPSIHVLGLLLAIAVAQVIVSARAVFAAAKNAKASLKLGFNALREIKKFFYEIAIKTGGLSNVEILEDALDLYNIAVDEAAAGRWIASVDPGIDWEEGEIVLLNVKGLEKISKLIDEIDGGDGESPEDDNKKEKGGE